MNLRIDLAYDGTPFRGFARQPDGWLVLNVGNDSQWRQFCAAAEVPDLAADPRFTTNPLRVQHRSELYPRLGEFRGLVGEVDPAGKLGNDLVDGWLGLA